MNFYKHGSDSIGNVDEHYHKLQALINYDDQCPGRLMAKAADQKDQVSKSSEIVPKHVVTDVHKVLEGVHSTHI